MKRKMIFLLMLVALLIPVVGASAATSNTKTTVKKEVVARSDGGETITTITTTVTTKVEGSKTTKTTKVTTVVVEKAADGFIESEETTVETTVEETTKSSKKSSSTSTKKFSMYKDVTKKKVGSKAYSAIKYLKKHGAFSGVFKGKKFYPKKKITKKQYLKVPRNLYGKNAPKDSIKKAKGYVTEKYALKKLVEVAKNIGISITWNGGSRKLTRAEIARYIKIFADFDPAFKKAIVH